MNGRVAACWMALSALAAAGCAHAPPTAAPLFHPAVVAADTGIIYFYRMEGAETKSSKRQGRALAVFIDDVPLGWFSRGGYVPFHLRPGDHFIKVLVGGHAHQTELRIEPFGEYFVRYDVSATGPTLNPVPSADARAEIAGCRLWPGGYDGRDRI
ncbi:MAG TPA: hypothetical protein VGP64_00550 [Polyangia bacterium]